MNSCKRIAFAAAAIVLAIGGAWADHGIENRAVDAQGDKVVLNVGDAAPIFESVDDQGKPWKSADHIGKKIVVIYFYPADLTGTCTAQACGFRDDMKSLGDKDVEVIGVSGDSVKNHKIFKAVHKLNFTLLADEKGSVAKAFGVPVTEGAKTFKTKDENGNPVELTRGCTIQRWTFVIGKNSKILLKNSKVKGADDSKQILDLVKSVK